MTEELDLKRVFPTVYRPGAVLRQHSHDEVTVLGTVLERRAVAADGSVVHADALAYAYSDTSENTIDIDESETWQCVTPADSAPRPVTYPVGPKLQKVFKEVIEAPGGALAWRIMRDAHELGYRVYVVGGAVRDLVTGVATRPDQINDLDLTGDIPSGLFADLARISALHRDDHDSGAGKRTQRKRVADIWIPHVTISASGVVHCYRLASGADRSKKPDQDHFLEYAPFKHDRARIYKLGRTEEFIFGSDPTRDCHWRDLTINALLYDPFRAEIVDPAGALHDIDGLAASHLTIWDQEACPRFRVVLRPFSLPVGSSNFWTAKAVARLIKSVDKFPGAELTAAVAWLRDSETLIAKVPARGRSAIADSLEQHLRTQFKVPATELGFGKAREHVRKAAEALAGAGAPEWFMRLIEEATKAVGDHGTKLGVGKGIWPAEGANAYSLELVEGQGGEQAFKLGSALAQPSDDPEAAFNHWTWTTSQHAIELVRIHEPNTQEAVRTYAFVADGQRLVPTDGQGRLVSFNVEGDLLSKLRDGDLGQLRALFPVRQDGRPQPRHDVTPDHEAPAESDWPADWPPRPAQIRSRPNPIDLPLTEDRMTPAMREMELLKRLRDAGLVDVSAPQRDLYWACMNSGQVELTPLGRYYWGEVAKGANSQQ